MSDNLRARINEIIDPYLVFPLSDSEIILDKVLDVINQERHAAAESMRDRCANVELKGPAEGNPDLYVLGWMNCILLYQSTIRELPLDTPDDGRG